MMNLPRPLPLNRFFRWQRPTQQLVQGHEISGKLARLIVCEFGAELGLVQLLEFFEVLGIYLHPGRMQRNPSRDKVVDRTRLHPTEEGRKAGLKLVSYECGIQEVMILEGTKEG